MSSRRGFLKVLASAAPVAIAAKAAVAMEEDKSTLGDSPTLRRFESIEDQTLYVNILFGPHLWEEFEWGEWKKPGQLKAYNEERCTMIKGPRGYMFLSPGSLIESVPNRIIMTMDHGGRQIMWQWRRYNA